jgi:hemerythrin-like domain-containing protein
MKATEQLKSEHEGIKLMLSILDAVANRIAGGQRIPQKDLEDIAAFLSVFADKCHHGKEEEHLFPALERAGVPREGGPIGVMLAEHAQGRQLIARLKEAIAEYGAGKKEASGKFARAAGDYAALLTQHIAKENNVLFPMADRLLAPVEDVKLVEGFEELERTRIGAGRHEQFHALLARLKKSYLA